MNKLICVLCVRQNSSIQEARTSQSEVKNHIYILPTEPLNNIKQKRFNNS